MANFFQKPAFPWILTLLLIGLNAVLLVFLWTGKGHGPKGRKMGPHHGPMKVAQILDFDEDQKKQFHAMRDSHFARMSGLRTHMHAHRDSAFSMLKGGNPDTAIAFAHLLEMGHTTTLLEKEIFGHFMQVRRLCKHDQLPKFDNDLISEMLKPKPGGHQGPPPHH